jgi:hypothetical protein
MAIKATKDVEIYIGTPRRNIDRECNLERNRGASFTHARCYEIGRKLTMSALACILNSAIFVLITATRIQMAN